MNLFESSIDHALENFLGLSKKKRQKDITNRKISSQKTLKTQKDQKYLNVPSTTKEEKPHREIIIEVKHEAKLSEN